MSDFQIPCISIVIPTRNRAVVLERVLPSYYRQKHVAEIIIVDDASNDATEDVIMCFSQKNAFIHTRYHKFEWRKGAAAARNAGIRMAKKEFVLFGEDDAFLGEQYTEILLKKMRSLLPLSIGACSGRLIYMQQGETVEAAQKRFGNGLLHKETFDFIKFGHNPEAIYDRDISLPLTHSMILAPRDLLLCFPYEEAYCRGSGFREESTYQIKAFIAGHQIMVTNDTHCMHLHEREVPKGGQRTHYFSRLYWSIYYTKCFYDQFYKQIQKRLELKRSKQIAIFVFTVYQLKNFFIDLFFFLKKRTKRLIFNRLRACFQARIATKD